MTSEAPRTPDSFNAYFRGNHQRLVRRLRGFARSQGIELNEQDAEDVVAAAFTEMAAFWPKVRVPDGYMWDRIGLRFLDHLRKRKRAAEPCDPDQLLPHAPAPKEFEPESHIATWDLEQAIENLSERERKIIQLYALGYTKQEQADALNVTPSNAGVILHRAKQKLTSHQGRQGQR
ncbi:sigma-70 family RNA polymerase sigma factor [Streptomyces sp. BH055]|uniref:sigma-70 family RNA polymerase sigma factor n=1 Tax=unclassified Streptomyces TaxID=2593676 RepID=UPI003BB769A4